MQFRKTPKITDCGFRRLVATASGRGRIRLHVSFRHVFEEAWIKMTCDRMELCVLSHDSNPRVENREYANRFKLYFYWSTFGGDDNDDKAACPRIYRS